MCVCGVEISSLYSLSRVLLFTGFLERPRSILSLILVDAEYPDFVQGRVLGQEDQDRGGAVEDEVDAGVARVEAGQEEQGHGDQRQELPGIKSK